MDEVTVERKTKETDVSVKLTIDGSGECEIDTGVPFLDHMLSQVARHGFFDLSIKATGDTEVDFHHTVEDCGILLGQAFDRAVGDKKGMARYGHAVVPLNEALSSVTVDFSGRPFLVFKGELPKGKVGDFDLELVGEFLGAFANNAGITLHVRIEYGGNMHHIAETIFKALARALDAATRKEPRSTGVPSTKGTL
ncbi:MAG: imidazoleglycerol-phosphate dehydratase [bacterium]|nr:MAG: imidazoleglycerol-phosphate dehydratase [bacterium]